MLEGYCQQCYLFRSICFCSFLWKQNNFGQKYRYFDSAETNLSFNKKKKFYMKIYEKNDTNDILKPFSYLINYFPDWYFQFWCKCNLLKLLIIIARKTNIIFPNIFNLMQRLIDLFFANSNATCYRTIVTAIVRFFTCTLFLAIYVSFLFKEEFVSNTHGVFIENAYKWNKPVTSWKVFVVRCQV